MKTKKQKKDYFNSLSEDLDIDIMDYIHDDELDDINDYIELLGKLDHEDAFNVDVIYYGCAMDYLSEHDSSLQVSMDLADGYDLKDINSELLASLLASSNARYDFEQLEGAIYKFFN
mgnify:FL=1|tara:strand:+ start:384 stop:734 length:351 start_codon:yes stop_codon:yes gene_type:complete